MDCDFKKVKRSELQMHAKKAGIRANMKTAELIKALSAHFKSSNIEPTKESNSSCHQDIHLLPTYEVKMAKGSNDPGHMSTEVKPKRGRRGHGSHDSGKENVQEDKENVQESIEMTKGNDDTFFQSEQKQKEEVKVQSPVKPRRRGRKSTRRTPSEENPKSAQKRVCTDTEAELPPAKRRNKRSTKSTSSPEEETQTIRRSTRKRTFSMSPPKTTASGKDSQDEKSQINKKVNSVNKSKKVKSLSKTPPDTGKGRTSRSAKKEDKSKTEDSKIQMPAPSPQKPIAVKVRAKKTGIPLPKIQATLKLTPGKPVNFKKVNKSQFEKLESIDDYLDRKRKRMEALTNSYKKTVKIAPSSAKRTPKQRASAVTPGITRIASSSAKKTPKQRASAVTPGIARDAKPVTKLYQSLFSPKPRRKTATVIKNVTFNTSKLKTPAKVTPFGSSIAEIIERRTPTPGRKKSLGLNMNFTGRKSTSGSTPFKFSASDETPSKQNNKFNLQASLQKHLPYKPYTGKLKPMTEIQPQAKTEIQPQAKKPAAASRIQRTKDNFKKPKVTSRQDRQRAATKNQTTKRKNAAMSRRGLSVV